MRKNTIYLLFSLLIPFISIAQNDTSNIWSLNDCINQALAQNVQVRQSLLSNMANEVNTQQSKNNKLPSVSSSVRQVFSWQNTTDANTGNRSFTDNSSTSYSLNSSVVLYNGSRLKNLVEQSELDMQKGIYDSETIKETISLNVLNAYLQVLFADEQVKNAEKQMESTTEQLNLAEERLNLSIISRSEYLQVKSQLATEKLSLANAQSQYAIARISLMQLMELPVQEDFNIVKPNMEDAVNDMISPIASNVYEESLKIRPQIKSAEYQKESALLGEKIAKSGFLPSLSADAGIGTGYSYYISTGYFDQLQNQLSPSVGLSLSIPIFQKKQIKTNVSLAKIDYQNAELSEINTKNQLRKDIEQTCVDIVSSQIEYEAGKEQLESLEESYHLAEEQFKNGLINSVDFLYEKTNLIVAESSFLQSKYQLIFNYKILDFFMGKPITL
jgi:outer membrane protein